MKEVGAPRVTGRNGQRPCNSRALLWEFKRQLCKVYCRDIVPLQGLAWPITVQPNPNRDFTLGPLDSRRHALQQLQRL
jgi:hypothetical protein